ncbi:MAG: 4-hydroxy-tetrahydrodipicolinate synthase [Terracidiphilus sp.]
MVQIADATWLFGARDSLVHFSVMETRGCGTALVTPFRADAANSIDEHALRALVDWQVDAGIDFLVACGSTGEAATLDEEEWLDAIRIVVDATRGRVPVWAGCTHNSTRTLLRLAERLREVRGVDCILSANPYYNKPTQEGQFQHFLALARAVEPIPVCLYNVPGRTAANLEPETVVRLVEAAPHIEAIKEASGKLSQIAAIVHSLAPRFKVFSGDDNLALATIGIGAQGLISVAANEAPAEMARMIRAALGNDWATARDLEHQYGRLFEANFWESNPGPVKTVLNLMGRTTDVLRLPLVTPAAATRTKLERLAGELGLLKLTPVGEGDLRLY